MKKLLIISFVVIVIGLLWAYLHFKKNIRTHDQLLDKILESRNQDEQDHENSNENLDPHTSSHSKKSWHTWADAHPHTYMKWTPKKEKNSAPTSSFEGDEEMNKDKTHLMDSKE